MLVHNCIRVGTLVDAMSAHEEIDAQQLADDDAPEGVTLERAAEIEAFLAVLQDEPRESLLGRFDIDEERWCTARKVWTERIEDEVMRAAAPGQKLSVDEKYRLSMRYSVAYAKAAERAREDSETLDAPEALAAAGASLGSNSVLRLGSNHG